MATGTPRADRRATPCRAVPLCRRRGTRLGVALLLTLVNVLAAAEAGRASTFSVSRTRIVLSAKTRSEVLTVQNDSAEPVRLQLSVFAWTQGADGRIVLAPTRDIVFFPPLIALAVGERRNVRVGTTEPPGASERTYRIFVEELPPVGPAPGVAPGQVRVLMRLGIPIFVQPATPVGGTRIDGLRLERGVLAFDLRNTGNVHVVATTVRVTGLAASGERVLQGALEGWYVLAGGTRAYALPLPADRCGAVAAVVVEVHTAQAVVTERLPAPSGACGP